ncbi:hypothetical protein pb186bvf_001641 [Paramecium bursaria]
MKNDPEQEQLQPQVDYDNQYASLVIRQPIINSEQVYTPKILINDIIKGQDPPPTQHNDGFGLKRFQTLKKNTGSTMMVCFMMKSFLQRIGQRKRRLVKMTNSHLNIIQDNGSDSNSFLDYVDTQRVDNFNMSKLTKLFQLSIFAQDSRIVSLKKNIVIAYNVVFKQIQNVFSKIPLIHPESNRKLIWDAILFIIRILLLVLVPLDIGFQTRLMFHSLQGLSVWITITIILDLFVRINTVSYLNGQAIVDRMKILVFVLKQSLGGDLLTITILIAFLISQPANYQYFVLVGTMYQYKYVHEFQQRSDQTGLLTKSQKGYVNLLKLLGSLLYLVHLYSCIFFFVSSQELNGSWIEKREILDSPVRLQYLESFYFSIVTMLTIGYGDNLPYNSAEKISTCVFIIGACLWFSYSINFIGSIISDITQNKVERDRKMRVMNKYFQKRFIPYQLQYQQSYLYVLRIKEYLNYRWKEEDEIDLQMEQALIESLSDELKEELDKQIHFQFVSSCEFLTENFSVEFQEQIQKLVKRRIIEPYNLFDIEFEGCNNLCLIEQGEVAYQHKDGQNKIKPKISSKLQQDRFICIKDFIIDSKDLKTFKAIGYVSLLTLSKKDFLECLKDFPLDQQQYCLIKDKIILNPHQVKVPFGVYCPACQNFDHEFKECQIISYIPDRELIIKKYQFSTKQERSNHSRKTKLKGFKAIANLELINDSVEDFQFDNPTSIKQQIKLLQYQDMDSPKKEANDSFDEVIHTEQQEQSDHQPQSPNFFIQLMPMQDMIQTQNRIKTDHSQFNLNVEISKGRRLSKRVTNIQALHSTDVRKYQQRIQDFQDILSQRLKFLYDNLQSELDYHKNKQYYQDTEQLYIKLNHHQPENFDIFQNFEVYNVNSNMPSFIKDQKGEQYQWQREVIDQFIKYMNHPYEYIIRFLKNKQSQARQGKQIMLHRVSKALNKLKGFEIKQTKTRRLPPLKNPKKAQILPLQ